MQRQCVPPKATGKPCIGNAILVQVSIIITNPIVQACNIQPCDTEISLDQQYAKVNPLAVQTRQFSLRPMREERCIVKEGDLDLVRDDLVAFQVKPRLPARVVLNNQTLTIFETGNPKDTIFSIALSNLKVRL